MYSAYGEMMMEPTRQCRTRWQYSLLKLVLLPPIFAVIFWACRAGEFAVLLLSFLVGVYGVFATIAITGLCFGLLYKRVEEWFHNDGR
jgi:ABC-type transport system involved in cytochrome c biogenesis permease component